MLTVNTVAEILGFVTIALSVMIAVWKITHPIIYAIVRLPRIEMRVETLAAKVDLTFRLSGRAIYVCRPDGFNVYSSDALALMFGTTPDKMRGAGWAEAIIAEDRQRAVEWWIRCVQTHAPYRDEYTIEVNGKRTRIITEAYRHENIEGNIVLYVGSVRESGTDIRGGSLQQMANGAGEVAQE